MPRISSKNFQGKDSRIEIRISRDLKQHLEAFSDDHLESVVDTTTQAIKKYIGFRQSKPKKPKTYLIDDQPKTERLEVRIHPRLKDILIKFCQNHNIAKITTAVTSALIEHIGYKK